MDAAQQAEFTVTRKQEFLQLCLAAIAGYVDAFGLMQFKTYLSFMSGNTTQAASLLARANFTDLKLATTAVASFFIGVFLGNAATYIKGYQRKWMAYCIVGLGLISFLVLQQWIGLNKVSGVVIIATSIGYMNTVASKVGHQSINPDFVTGTLNSMAGHLAAAFFKKYPADSEGIWDTHVRRYFLLLLVWLSFIAGAMLCTLIFQDIQIWSMLIPIVALIILTIESLTNKSWISAV